LILPSGNIRPGAADLGLGAPNKQSQQQSDNGASQFHGHHSILLPSQTSILQTQQSNFIHP
jgi:hypothetical protein